MEDYISKDIQAELHALMQGMSTHNITSQLTYFLVKMATLKENSYSDSYLLMHIIGLISDSYFGMVATGDISLKKQ